MKTSFTYTLEKEQQQLLINELNSPQYESVDVPYTRKAVKHENCNILLYHSGKCLIQGKGAEDWTLFTLEPQILKTARLGYESTLDPALTSPHMGIDESGKGDFLGPLVIASAYVDPEISKLFKKLDVKDSKSISSDKKLMQIASEVRKILDDRFSIITIGPEAYNRLYKQFGNLNKLLAWGHARAIENLLEKLPDCPRAVADQFGPKSRIEQALLKKGRAIKFEQRPRAEIDPAVAAASILARSGFLYGLQKLGEQYNIPFPKGVSPKVKDTARKLVRKHGPSILEKVAKCHFKTAAEVV